MGTLIDAAIPPTISGDRFVLNRRQVEVLALPIQCPTCDAKLSWDFMGEIDWAKNGGSGAYRLQSIQHRHSRMAFKSGGFLSVDICPCLTEHRNLWDLIYAGCEPLIDRWKIWNNIQ